MTKTLIGAALTVAALSAAPTAAHASALGCVGKSVRGASSCVQISGEGTRVDGSSAGVSIGPRTTVRGFVRLFVNGRFAGQSSLITCSNGNFDKTAYCQGQRLLVNTTQTVGTKICGQFIFEGGGPALARACKTIKA